MQSGHFGNQNASSILAVHAPLAQDAIHAVLAVQQRDRKRLMQTAKQRGG